MAHKRSIGEWLAGRSLAERESAQVVLGNVPDVCSIQSRVGPIGAEEMPMFSSRQIGRILCLAVFPTSAVACAMAAGQPGEPEPTTEQASATTADSDASSDGGSGDSDSSSYADPCAKVPGSANGLYCSASTQSGFDPYDALDNMVYDCSNGQTARITNCGSAGCIVESAGISDQCDPGILRGNPCAGVFGANDGWYCHASTQGGFNPRYAGDNLLYDCQNGTVVRTTSCGNGCFVAPPGQADGCL